MVEKWAKRIGGGLLALIILLIATGNVDTAVDVVAGVLMFLWKLVVGLWNVGIGVIDRMLES